MAILSDFRYKGGTSASVAEEVRAQANAGISTVLVQIASPHLKSARPFNPRIIDCLRKGAADLALRNEVVTARVLVIRQPRIFSVEPDSVPRVRADKVVMVINQGPRDLGDSEVYYDLDDVRQRIEACFGEDVHWAPIGPLVRRRVHASDPSFPLSHSDWHNIIDVNDWWTDRKAPVDTIPVIGRHSRPDPKKWPRAAEEILQAYPPGDDFRVRVLGGGEQAVTRIGKLPDSWSIMPFGSVGPQKFLRGIDYFVYFHDPDWVEAFGRTILEAMASGTPVIIPEHFRSLFADAALYATPDQVQGIVRKLHADWNRYREVSTKARDFVERNFGHRSHIIRLNDMGIPSLAASPRPSNPTATPHARAKPTAASPPPSSRILMLSSNGYGLGHITRLLAVARRLPSGFKTTFVTQSQAAPLVQMSGYLTEYIPSSGYLNVPADRWNVFLHDRLLHLVGMHQPVLVAVDGTVPYAGLLKTMEDHPEITWVWVRRAMWKPGLGHGWIERGRAFDFILEPGEFAAPADEGATIAQQSEVRTVGPITYLDSSELLDAGSARRELELDERPAVLLQLGSGRDANDARSLSDRVARYLGDREFQVVLAQSPIAAQGLTPPSGTRVVERYPLSKYLRGFDLVVSAAGYNAFHELIGFGIPSIFSPQAGTPLDDQEARVRYAEKVGAALALYDPGEGDVERVLRQAADPEVRAELSRRCSELATPNGAADAASWIAALCPTDSSAGG